MFDSRLHSSISGTAGANDTDGNAKLVFVIRNAVTFIANDSPTNGLLVNFDAPIGRAGTILLYPGEALSDLKLQCNELYVQGVGGAAEFRAVGS